MKIDFEKMRKKIDLNWINWLIMSAIMIISLIFAFKYFISLRDVAAYNSVTRQMTTIYDANTKLDTLFTSDKPSRNFASINENMRTVYDTLNNLENNEIIKENGFSEDIKLLQLAFNDKIDMIDKVNALNAQNNVILRSIEQKYIDPNARYEIVNIFSRLAQLNYNNFTEIYAAQEEIKNLTPHNLQEQEFIRNANQVVSNFTQLNLTLTNNENLNNAKFKGLREKFANFNSDFYGSFAEMTMVFTAIFLTFLLITYMVNSDAIYQKRKLRPYKIMLDKSDDAVILLNDRFEILYANNIAIDTFGYKIDELKGKDIDIIKARDDHRGYIKELKSACKETGYFSKDLLLVAKAGDEIDQRVKVMTLDKEEKKRPLYAFFARNTQEKAIIQKELNKAKADLNDQIYIDHLTGFENERALNGIINSEKKGIVIYITIANFANLRLFYNAETVNEIIKTFSRSLALLLDANKIKAGKYRIQGDEFCLFYEGKEIQRDTKIILDYFEDRSIKLSSNPAFPVATINIVMGISSKQDNIGGANRIFQAIMAMYNAAQKNEHIEYYTRPNPIEEKYAQNQLMVSTIQQAIKSNRVFVLVQPIFDITKINPEKKYGTKGSNCVPLVYEILIRLVDRSGKTRTPGEFLEVAKQASLYTALTRVVINEAFRLIDKFPGTKFSVNLSFYDIANKEIRVLLEDKLKNAKNAKNLFIEILESEEFDDYDSLRDFISTAKRRGCTIAIDDFGSGYSNYYRILTLDVDFIKIDGALIKNIVEDHNSRAIVETIATFAKNQNYQIIAEYVENHEISKILEKMGIKYMQGFWYSTPMEPSKIAV